MASQKRLPKPNGESECSRRTATVPVTCFIDVKRNATTKTGYEGACSCSVRMRSVNAGSAVQARRTSRCATLSIASPSTIIPSPAGRERARVRAGGEGLAPQGMPVQDPNDRSLYPTSRLHFVVWSRPQC